MTLVIKRTRLRRAIGAVLVIAGAVLMWMAPRPTYTSLSGTGLALLLAGIALELVGIFLERREEDRRLRRSPHPYWPLSLIWRVTFATAARSRAGPPLTNKLLRVPTLHSTSWPKIVCSPATASGRTGASATFRATTA